VSESEPIFFSLRATSLTEFSFSLLAVTDQIHQSSQETQEHTQTLTQNQYQCRTISQKFVEFIIESTSPKRTKAKCEWIRCNFEQFSAIHVNPHHWIAEPAIQREHAAGSSALRAWLQAVDRRRRRRRGEGFHKIRIGGRKKGVKPAYQKRFRAKDQKKRFKSPIKNTGNT